MRLLTDHPDHTRAFLSPANSWQPFEPHLLGPAEEAAWRVLGGNRPLYVANAASAPAPCEADCCGVLIDQAPASQFDAVVQAAHTAKQWPHRLICLALTGQGFHGQRGRPWQALRGNLHFTGQYAVEIDARQAMPAITALPAVATLKALQSLAPDAAFSIKWVNDILFEGAKVAGVITATQAADALIQRITLGIGINIQANPSLPSVAYGVPAGTLQGLQITLPALWQALMREIGLGLDLLARGEGQALVNAYRQHADFIGREVVIWPEDNASVPLVAGQVTALNDDLSLTLHNHSLPVQHGRMTYQSLESS